MESLENIGGLPQGTTPDFLFYYPCLENALRSHAAFALSEPQH